MINRIDSNKPLIPLKDLKIKNKENTVDKTLTPNDIIQYNELLKKYKDRASKVIDKLEKEQEAEDRKKEREEQETLEKITDKDLELFSRQTFQEVFIKSLPEEWQKQIKK